MNMQHTLTYKVTTVLGGKYMDINTALKKKKNIKALTTQHFVELEKRKSKHKANRSVLVCCVCYNKISQNKYLKNNRSSQF